MANGSKQRLFPASFPRHFPVRPPAPYAVQPCAPLRYVRVLPKRSALLPHVHAFGVGALPHSFPAASPAGINAHVLRPPLDIVRDRFATCTSNAHRVPFRSPSRSPPPVQPNTTNATRTNPRVLLSFKACPWAWLRLMRCKWWPNGLGKPTARNGEPSGTMRK